MKTLLAVLALAVSGCATVGPGGVSGTLYSGHTIGSGVGPAASGSKQGEACATSILGIIGIGDASIDAAKQAGGISQVATIDHTSFSILGLYGSLCTVVKGE